MEMKIPAGHKPRFDNFELSGFIDETLREGAERCLFAVEQEKKLELLEKIIQTGVKEIIVGSGPEDPSLILKALHRKFEGKYPSDTKFIFILLLNSWEPIYHQFAKFPREYMKEVVISFGMVEYQQERNLLESIVGKFQKLGVETFRASLLNNFSDGVDESKYQQITEQIERCKNLGFKTIRVNDSLGLIYPETMAVLASNLVHDYPELNFCLHAHDDRGLGLQNALTSIYHGFNMIEGAVAGYGNRSGLPALEVLDLIFREKNIKIAGTTFDEEKLTEAASLADETFMTVPAVYRPVSGLVVKKENLGVLNIPDYLGVERKTDYFLNNVGLHHNTVAKALEVANVDQNYISDEEFIECIREEVKESMFEIYDKKRRHYDKILKEIKDFYSTDIMSSVDIQECAKKKLVQHTN